MVAIASGARAYRGRLCIHGHDALRSTKTGACLACKHLSNQAWASAHPELARRSRYRPKFGPPAPVIMVTYLGAVMSLKNACAAADVDRNIVYANARNGRAASHQDAFDWEIRKQGEPELKRKPRQLGPRKPRAFKAKRPNPKAKHFIDGEALFAEVIVCRERGRNSNKLGTMLMLMATRFFEGYRYRRYTYRDEMQDDALMAMLRAIPQFDVSVSQNAFAFLTSVMRNAATQFLREKRREQAVLGEHQTLAAIELEEAAPGAVTRDRPWSEHRSP